MPFHPEDGDVYCGAVTATVERDLDEIVWRDLAFSTFDFEAQRWHHDRGPFAGWSG